MDILKIRYKNAKEQIRQLQKENKKLLKVADVAEKIFAEIGCKGELSARQDLICVELSDALHNWRPIK